MRLGDVALGLEECHVVAHSGARHSEGCDARPVPWIPPGPGWRRNRPRLHVRPRNACRRYSTSLPPPFPEKNEHRHLHIGFHWQSNRPSARDGCCPYCGSEIGERSIAQPWTRRHMIFKGVMDGKPLSRSRTVSTRLVEVPSTSGSTRRDRDHHVGPRTRSPAVGGLDLLRRSVPARSAVARHSLPRGRSAPSGSFGPAKPRRAARACLRLRRDARCHRGRPLTPGVIEGVR